jgi:hypothetical protein
MLRPSAAAVCAVGVGSERPSQTEVLEFIAVIMLNSRLTCLTPSSSRQYICVYEALAKLMLSW